MTQNDKTRLLECVAFSKGLLDEIPMFTFGDSPIERANNLNKLKTALHGLSDVLQNTIELSEPRCLPDGRPLY